MNYIKDLIDYITSLFKWWIVIMPWEGGVRVRLGKHLTDLVGGVYLKLPLIDTIYVKTTRLRVISMPVQTISTKDKQVLSIMLAIGYVITNVRLLYETLHSPDGTISNMILSQVSSYISQHDLSDCEPSIVEAAAIKNIDLSKYGVELNYVKVIGFAVVRTFRLIQDSHWTPDNVDMISTQ